MIGRVRRRNLWGDVARARVAPTQLARAYATSSDTAALTRDQEGAVASEKPSHFDGVVPAVRQFYAIHHHFTVPAGFRVPKRQPSSSSRRCSFSDPSWSPEFEGFSLGFKLRALLTNPKHRRSNLPLIDELRDIDFPVDVDWRAYLWKNSTMRALEAYKEIHGDLLVPRNFVVPRDDLAWPLETRGLCLGLKVMNIRQRRYILLPTEAADLERIGFVWDAHEHVWTTRFLPALEVFKKLHGHCLVDRKFVVPSEEPWPRDIWRLALGNFVSTVRSPRSLYDLQVKRDRDRLDELGFVWDVADDRWSNIILPALETFGVVYGERRRILQNFIVPAEDPWPMETWGFRLGQCVHNIRTLATFRTQVLRNAKYLDKIGWLKPLTEGWVRAEFWPEGAKPPLPHELLEQQ